MDIPTIILFVICFFELIICFYIFFTNPKSEIRRVYSSFIFSVFLWGISNALMVAVSDLNNAFFWGKLTYLAAGLIAVFLLYFSWIFPYKKSEVTLFKKIILILPPVIISLLLYFTNWIVDKPVFRHGINDLTLGSAYYLYVLFFAGYIIWGLVNLFKKYFNSDGVHRWQLKILLWGLLISATLGMTTNLFLPMFDITHYGLYGPISSVAWLGVTSYIVFKK